MKVTRMKIKTNKHMDGFYTVNVSGFGPSPRFAGQLPSDTVNAVNKIEVLEVGGQHYIDGNYIEILSIETESI